MTKENEEAIEVLREWGDEIRDYCDGGKHMDDKDRQTILAIDFAIKALEQENVLEKIRAEILDEAEYAYADFDRYKEDILYAEPDELPNDDFRYGMERAVEIINKYRKGGAK